MNVTITEFGIEVSNSDVIDSKQKILLKNEKTNSCRLISKDEPKAGHWLKILGEKLAGHLRENGFEIYKDQEVLLAFPKGYNLYCHTTVSNNGKKRNDTYLCGIRKFCSPNEFASHLIWLVTDRSVPCKCIHCQGKKVDDSESIIPSSPSTIKSDDSREMVETASTTQSLALSPEQALHASQPRIESSESSMISSPPFEEIEEPPSHPSFHVYESSSNNKGLKRSADDESFSKPDEGMKKVKSSPTVSTSHCDKNPRKNRSLSMKKKSNQKDRSQSSRRVRVNKKSKNRADSTLKSNDNGKSHRYSKISKLSQKKNSTNVNTRPKKIQAEYRSGEIIWVCVSKTKNHELLSRINESSNDSVISIEYWPGIIYSLNKIGDYVNFKVKLVVLGIMVDVRRNMMKPWKAYDPEIPEGLLQEIIGDQNHEQNSLKINESTKDYVRAVHRAREASNTYSPMKAYWPNEVDNDHKPKYDINSEEAGLLVEKDFAHYEYILFGAEKIQEGDLVRLVPENSMNLDGEPEFPEFLEIKEIYDHRSEGIKLTGNILQRGELLNPDGPYRLEDYKWWINDDVDELFTVDLEDIAGRFYLMMPHVTERTIASTPKSINDRMSIIESGSDLEKSARTEITSKLKIKC